MLSAFENLNTLTDTVKLLLLVGIIIAILLLERFILIPYWRKFAARTKNKWDDKLLNPLSKRLYFFTVILATDLLLESLELIGTDVLNDFRPIISSIHVLIAVSTLSIGIKYILPAAISYFEKDNSISVKGSKPLIINASRIIVWFCGIYLILQIMKIEVVGILASFAVFSVILGFAMQQTLGNIMNSFMMSLDSPFEPGDRIEVDEILGTVINVGILSTKILTREEKLVIIPNNTLVNSTITNNARGGGGGIASRISLIVDVGVDYAESIDHVKFVLLELIQDCPYILDDPEPRVLLVDLSDYSKDFRIFGWVDDYQDEWIARDWILRKIDERFITEEILIPYPTSVELPTKQAVDKISAKKKERQQIAKKNVVKIESELKLQREYAKYQIQMLTNKLEATKISKKRQKQIEAQIEDLRKLLEMFHVSDD